MDPHELIQRLEHVAVTTVTPMYEDGKVDFNAIARQVEAITAGGIRILVPCGNTGEFASLDDAEARTVVERTVAAAPNGTTIVAGVGGASVRAAALARQAESVGAHAVMVHHPTHTYIDRDALLPYYERILSATELGMVLYKRGPELSDKVIAELVEHERVVGVKYAVNDLNAFANLVAAAGGQPCAWLCGTAERFAPFFHLAGADGFTSGIANFAPQLPTALHDALHRGEVAKAMTLRQQLAPFEELRASRHNALNVPAVKEAMRQLSLDSGYVRDPLQRPSSEERERISAMLHGFGLPA
jgi:4-hydroxy-tetrahydrodipicolinate synthase